MNEPKVQGLIIRPKNDAYQFREGGTSTSIVSAFPSKVEFNEEEGYLMWFEPDLKYPIAGLLDPVALTSADRIKKYAKLLLRLLATPPFIFASMIAFVLPMRKFKVRLLDDFSEFCFAETKEHIFTLDKYTRAVREMRRAAEVVNVRINGNVNPGPNSIGFYVQRIIWAVAVILENDRAYRYALQDIFSELRKDWLRDDPVKEINRLVNIFVSRFTARQRNFKQIGRIVGIAVKLQPEIREFAVQFLLELYISKIVMKKWDKYMAYLQDGYDYHGLSKEERTEIHKTL